MITSSPSYFFFGLLLAVMVLAIFIFLPFLTPLVLAMALAVIFDPLHEWIVRHMFHKKEKSSLAAFISIIIIAVVVLVPLTFMAFLVYNEINSIYSYLINESGRTQFVDTLNHAVAVVQNYFPNVYPDYTFDSFNIVTILQNVIHWAFSNINVIFDQIVKIFLGLLVMFLALFYFLRDGHEFRRQIIMLSPLGDVEDEHILEKLEQAIRSIFVGSISVGIVQGISMGLAFTVFNIPNPALWGTMTVLAALIPGIGIWLVLGPGIAYLVLNSSIPSAFGLLVWGIFAIVFIDNMLGPYLVNRGIKIHPFLILLSVLGGIAFFGLIGFVLGPLVLAFLFSLLEIYRTAKKRIA